MSHFCKLLTNQYHITYDDVKPCCWIKRYRANVLDPAAVKAQALELSKVTDWIPECEYCHTLENSGLESPRIQYNKSIQLDDTDKITDSVKVEIQIDDDCNAACLMCSDYNSTTWANYNEKTVKAEKIFFKQYTVDQRFESVKQFINFDKIKALHFFGGEPMRTNTHLRVLELVPEPQKVSLVYVTNGSIFPDAEIIELWSKFKQVHIAVSIDGIDEHFDYLRWPLRWTQVKDNLLKYANLDPVKFSVNTSFIISPLNILYQDRYTAWADEFFRHAKIKHSRWFKNPSPVLGIMNMNCVTPRLKQAVADKFGTDSAVYKLILPFDSEKYDKFIQYVEFHDQHRQLNWKTTFSEVAACL